MLAARAEGDGYSLTVAEPHRAIPALLDELERSERPLARLTTRHVSLEDVFVSLTGRHLRDDETEAETRARNPAGRKRGSGARRDRRNRASPSSLRRRHTSVHSLLTEND